MANLKEIKIKINSVKNTQKELHLSYLHNFLIAQTIV